MRIKSKLETREMDMTSMIDIVFLLIAFFMFLLNFSEAEQDQRIKLPSSELAIPTKLIPNDPISVQIMQDGIILFKSRELTLGGFARELASERNIYRYKNIEPKDVTVIIRADQNGATGEVLEIVKECQTQGFSTFRFVALSVNPE